MAYDLEEQEKLAEIKALWQRYGNLVTAIVAIVALGVLALNGYNWWRLDQSQKASVLYDQMQKGLAAKNPTLTKETAATLMDQYARTSYAQMAALQAARANVDAGDLKAAQAQLQWAVDHAQDDQYRAIARLRLASVQSDLNQPDAALATLSVKVPEQFVSAFDDRRGDIYLSQNKIAEAKAQYQDALDHLKDVGQDLQLAYTNVEKLKLDALASATGNFAAAPAAPAAAAPAAVAAPAPAPSSEKK